MGKNEHLPVYSVQAFSAFERRSQQFQLEPFDANRHYEVKYPHRHDFFEVLFLFKGSGIHVIDENKYQIEPPCVFFLSPGQAHMLEFSNDIEGYLFIFTADFYLIYRSNHNRLIEFPFFYTIHQTNPPLKLTDQDDVFFLECLFLRGIQEVNKKQDCSLDLLRSLLDLILNFCAGLYPAIDTLCEKGKGHLVVKKFLQRVEENIFLNLSISDYARIMAISPGYLTQTIKKLSGKTSSEIIKSKQILEIKRLLLHTNLGIAEIAEYMHFADQSYFTRFFKRETGVTPLVFRNNDLK